MPTDNLSTVLRALTRKRDQMTRAIDALEAFLDVTPAVLAPPTKAKATTPSPRVYLTDTQKRTLIQAIRSRGTDDRIQDIAQTFAKRYHGSADTILTSWRVWEKTRARTPKANGSMGDTHGHPI